MVVLDAKGIHYKKLNTKVRELLTSGVAEVQIKNVNGQRYIGDGIRSTKSKLTLEGTPGNDMAAYMDGLEITIKGNAQDAMGNTMNDGKIIVHGHAGDTVGYAMRGGKIFIRDGVGYRVGIHMKEYMDKVPAIVIGGKAGDFLGEYMAGGVLIVLGLNLGKEEEIVGAHCGTGMHGGVMYIRGEVKDYNLGQQVNVMETTPEDLENVRAYVSEYVEYFGGDLEKIMEKPFIKVVPGNESPYGKLYCGW